MANIKIVMIGKYKNLLPVGVPGELLIIGIPCGSLFSGNVHIVTICLLQNVP